MKFFLGLHYFISGLRLITKPGLKRFVIIPFGLNILFFVGLFFFAKSLFASFNHWFTHFLPHWLHWLSSILWIIFLIGFFLILMMLFVSLTNLIAAPFNSLLAEKVELYLTGKAVPQKSMLAFMADIPRLLGRQLTILGYYLLSIFLLLVLFFIPGVQLLVPVAWFLFNAWFLTLQNLDYPTDNHGVDLSKVRRYMNRNRSLSLGFGIGALGFAMVPLLNCISVPVGIAGAVKWWIEENRELAK